MKKLRMIAKKIIQCILIIVGKHYNYFLIKGNLNPLNRISSHNEFMKGPWSVNMDYIRNATLELLSKEIKEQGIKGSVAEVGVFQGDFASLINYNFSDRKLYLFDTFEGFDLKDSVSDRAKGYSKKQHNFSQTSIDLVMSKMKSPSNVVIKKGWFPETAKDIEEERFCFVSLDTDLYDPIYAGLDWFYPRLVEGGYIIVHDYYNDTYKGSKAAVRQYAKEFGVTYCLIPDTGGSVVIGKPFSSQLSSNNKV